MGRLTVKEILKHPELAQYIKPQNCNLFLLKRTDYEQVANMANVSITEAMQRIVEEHREDEVDIFEKMSSADKDVLVTKEYAKSINEVFRDYQNKISSDKLMLYLGFTAMRALQALNRTIANAPIKDSREVFFENGDYLVVNSQSVRGNIAGKPETTIDNMKDRLARVVLLTASQFENANPKAQKNKKNLSEISGIYFNSGLHEGEEKIRFTEKELVDFARGYELMTSMTPETLKQSIEEKLLNKNALIKHFEKGKINKDAAVNFMLEGVITEDEFVKRIYKKKTMAEVAKDPETSDLTKLILFDKQKISVDTFKEIADFSIAYKAYAFKDITVDAFQDLVKSKGLEPDEATFQADWNFVATAYTHESKEDVITSITEFLTHNIFNYKNSMEYLKYMTDRGVITANDAKYIEGIVQDFRIDELENSKDNELVEVSGETSKGVQAHTRNLTIDPQVRINYLTSLGAVKKLRVKGETFLKDAPENRGKRNSLDGYELFIIPSKKIAVLEKLYETTRDKNGNMVYRKNQKGELIPAIENATYVMPIEMAKEFVENKNKKDLIRSPYVERAMHTADWAISVERSIKKIRPEVEFNKENSKKWNERVRQNYKKNKDERVL